MSDSSVYWAVFRETESVRNAVRTLSLLHSVMDKTVHPAVAPILQLNHELHDVVFSEIYIPAALGPRYGGMM